MDGVLLITNPSQLKNSLRLFSIRVQTELHFLVKDLQMEVCRTFSASTLSPSCIRSSQPKTTLPYTLCVVAYAQANLREVMFRMPLKTSDLKDALSIPNKEFFFAASTRRIRLVPLEDPSEETVHVLRRRIDMGRRDSLPLPYSPPPVE